MTDWRAQEYEDNYWAERDLELFEKAVEQVVQTRVEERYETNAEILGG